MTGLRRVQYSNARFRTHEKAVLYLYEESRIKLGTVLYSNANVHSTAQYDNIRHYNSQQSALKETKGASGGR